MFSNLTIGILVGLGFGAWVYSKLNRRTGGNTTNSVTGAVIVGLITCLVITTILSIIFRNT